jgi:hypothetical protein
VNFSFEFLGGDSFLLVTITKNKKINKVPKSYKFLLKNSIKCGRIYMFSTGSIAG